MIEYYKQRASEYERVYQKPERQADLDKLAGLLSTVFAGQDVLEVACGTGYWTQFIAKSAKSIFASDINAEVIEIARQKNYETCRVTFLESDVYALPCLKFSCNAGFHGFWWSHIPIEKMNAFLNIFHSVLPAGSPIVMIDNRYVEGSSTPISRRDEYGNTYQTRRLQNGSTHEVLKNFPTVEELCRALEFFADDLTVKEIEYFWMAQYKIRKMEN